MKMIISCCTPSVLQSPPVSALTYIHVEQEVLELCVHVCVLLVKFIVRTYIATLYMCRSMLSQLREGVQATYMYLEFLIVIDA